MPDQMVIRLVVRNPMDHMVKEICEMSRIRSSGKRDLQSLELFLDKASEAMDRGFVPEFEFLKP